MTTMWDDKDGPDDAICIVWALGMFIFYSFLVFLLTKYFIIKFRPLNNAYTKPPHPAGCKRRRQRGTTTATDDEGQQQTTTAQTMQMALSGR
jgi:hypothetical protein